MRVNETRLLFMFTSVFIIVCTALLLKASYPKDTIFKFNLKDYKCGEPWFVNYTLTTNEIKEIYDKCK